MWCWLIDFHAFIEKSVVQVNSDFNIILSIPGLRRKRKEYVCGLEAP